MKRIYHEPLLCRCSVFAEQNPIEYKINHMILIKKFHHGGGLISLYFLREADWFVFLRIEHNLKFNRMSFHSLIVLLNT